MNPSLPQTPSVGAGAKNAVFANLLVTGQLKVAGEHVTNTEGIEPVLIARGLDPVSDAFATVELDPLGADNVITLTAPAKGVEGNFLSAEITVPEDSAEIVISQAGYDITIAAGAKHRMTVAGTLSPDASGDLAFAGTFDVYNYWTTDGNSEAPESGTWVKLTHGVGGGQADIEVFVDGVPESGSFYAELCDSPELGTYLNSSGSTGTPTVTASAPTAAQVVAAITVSEFTFTAAGDGVNAVAEVARLPFEGGTARTATTFVESLDGTLYYYNSFEQQWVTVFSPS